MKRYRFTGHLSPLPPGIRLPISLSGEVCLPTDVEAEIALLKKAHAEHIERLRARIALLERNIKILKARNARAKKRR